MRWSDAFVIRTRERTGNSRTKTRQGEQIVWDGCFAGQPLCVISTVRLVGSNLAHFLVSSNARIGSHDWNLRGGHYVDLRVISKHPLSREELLRLGQLAKTEEHRPIYIRQQHERLDDALSVPIA